MLNMTSGAFEFLGDAEIHAKLLDRWAHDDVIARAAAHPPAFSPGDAYQYSNTNYLLVGRIIEKVTGDSYDHLLRTEILNRVDLPNTFLSGYETGSGAPRPGHTGDPAGNFAPMEYVVSPASLALMVSSPTLKDGTKSSYGLGGIEITAR